MTTHATPGRLQHRLGALALAGMLVFVLACTVAQFLRSDLDWMQVPLSFYLINGYGIWVRVAYFVMAAALVMFAVGAYLALSRTARSAAPLLLFVVAAVALCVTAAEETNTWANPNTWHGFVHGVAAQTTFLCVTVAMMLQGWHLRADVRWQRWFKPAFSSAVVCFVALWVQALWRDVPRGLTQKVLIVLILAWLVLAAWRLWRGPSRAVTT